MSKKDLALELNEAVKELEKLDNIKESILTHAKSITRIYEAIHSDEDDQANYAAFDVLMASMVDDCKRMRGLE
jgi:hypothetical protein